MNLTSNTSPLSRVVMLWLGALCALLISACGGGKGTVGLPSGTALYTNAPATVNVAARATAAYTIGGGTPLYSVSSSNRDVATVLINGNGFSVTGVAPGTATIAVSDAAGAQTSVAITVTGSVDPGNTALFTTAPSTVTVAAGASSIFSIGGGRPAYAVSSSNTGIATAAINGTNFVIGGAAPGTAEVVVFDATGATTTIAVTVTVGGSRGLYTTAPSTVTLSATGTATFDVGGGSAPYTATSSNTTVIAASVTGKTLTISAKGIGTGADDSESRPQVRVFDAKGDSVSITVEVTPPVLVPLFTSAPSAVTLAVGTQHEFMVGGGAGGYVASTSNQGVVTVAQIGQRLIITAWGNGTAKVSVLDSKGSAISFDATVTGARTLFTTAPEAVTLALGTDADYTIGGGSGVYTATSSNPSAVSVVVFGSRLTLTGRSIGNAKISVFDGTGATVTFESTVAPIVITPVVVSPSAVTGNVGDVLEFYVNGGTPGYTVNSNNPTVASISPIFVGASSGTFKANLVNVGETTITTVDARGQTASVTVTVEAQIATLRLSPNAIVVGENSVNTVALNIYGGTGPYRAFTSDLVLSSVSITGSTLNIGLGSQTNRCITPVTQDNVYIPNGTFDVTVTAVDSLGASATSVLTIKDNGAGPGLGCPP